VALQKEWASVFRKHFLPFLTSLRVRLRLTLLSLNPPLRNPNRRKESNMPMVNGKKFAYTAKGKMEAKAATKKADAKMVVKKVMKKKK
jgi:hypothetical protein